MMTTVAYTVTVHYRVLPDQITYIHIVSPDRTQRAIAPAGFVSWFRSSSQLAYSEIFRLMFAYQDAATFILLNSSVTTAEAFTQAD